MVSQQRCQFGNLMFVRLLWVVTLMLTTITASESGAAPRPNIVIMLTDDQRWDALGVVQQEMGTGGRMPWMVSATPNMDSLARDGFRFRNAFVVSALCSPSRAAFLTGRYNHLNGVANNHTPLPPDSVTYATALRAAGYRTGYFGKWHMGTQEQRPGFTEFASYVGQGRYLDAAFLVNGVKRSTTGWVDDVTTGFAVDFIQRHATRPFVAVIGFKSAHDPRLPPPRLATRFPTARLTDPVNAASYAPYDRTPAPYRPTDNDVRNYSRTIVGVDQNVGRILSLLRTLGLAQDTIVVFASDNGYLFGEHGLGDKRAAYEDAIRIPLLIRYPRLGRRNITIDAMVLNIDLTPTLLQLAGVPVPRAVQGSSMTPLLRGQVTSIRQAFLYEYFYEEGYDVPTIVALRHGGHKLVHYPSHPAWTELFNLRADPSETNNLASDPDAAELLGTMSRALAMRRTAVGYRIPSYADPYPPSEPSGG
jgi:arylsulfatase A-like enzyme